MAPALEVTGSWLVQILDCMGYEPSVWNKTNIHIGGVYGDKQGTMERFAKNFKRLSPNAQKRLTLENDDWPSGFAVSDLLWVHKEAGIPIVFDFHHHKFCPGAENCPSISALRNLAVLDLT